MTAAALVLFGVFFVLLFLNVPIALSLGTASLVALLTLDMPLQMLPTIMFASTGKFGLLAIPLFTLAGFIMERCGISERLVRFVSLIMGPIPGALALVTVAVGIIFAGISGSGPADVAALGAILIPAMVARGYGRPFTAGLMAASGSIAIIFPPSIAFIIYGVLSETSIGDLFLAGIIPGVIMGLAMGAYSYFVGRREGYIGERRGTWREIGSAFLEAVWGLLAPLIILGGIYGGIFTPTEAAGIAVVYGLFVGIVIYRAVRWQDLYKLMVDAAVASAVVMFIVGCAGLFAWVIVVKGVASGATQALLSVATNKYIFFLLVNVMLLVAGMFLDAISIYYITVPILIPVLAQFGISPIHFGVIMAMNLAIGQFTPPVGVNLYVACNVGDVSFRRLTRAIWPFVFASLAALVAITLIPALSLWIPTLARLR